MPLPIHGTFRWNLPSLASEKERCLMVCDTLVILTCKGKDPCITNQGAAHAVVQWYCKVHTFLTNFSINSYDSCMFLSTAVSQLVPKLLSLWVGFGPGIQCLVSTSCHQFQMAWNAWHLSGIGIIGKYRHAR